MLALTLQQPWASAIAELGKDFENRTWRPPASVVGQRIAIHAGLTIDNHGISWLVYGARVAGVSHLWCSNLPRGVIVCTALVAGAVRVSDSPWFAGPWGWHLTGVQQLRRPVRMRGAQGLFTLPPEVEREVLQEQLVP